MNRGGNFTQSYLQKFLFSRVVTRNASKGSSSSRWLKRQQTDLFVKKALEDNYLCRSGYKLIELDDRFHFLQPGRVVIDCGASPGSWTQVAVNRVLTRQAGQQKGLVIAVDLLDIEDILGATILSRCDFTDASTQRKILSLLPPAGADVIMSDMAPNATGNHTINHEAILNLCESAFEFSKDVLKPGGRFLCKLWDGYGTQDFIKILQGYFKQVKECKPQASRKESAEIYLYAENFKK
ncbi:ribosomal RNA large subunit methyltransferase E-like [Porites lutea]|uniref:ribosomal RNA large subunit methyltransferase E-like n=1 Tax=Porites lutea TaxID=51062 RepID=UPI003CC566C0